MEIKLDNIIKIVLKNGVTSVTYSDGTSHIINEDVTFIKDLRNTNDAPIVDHCI